MEVLVTGGDTELGRTVAEGFRNEGHRVVISGARREELEVAAKELDIDAVVCDTTEPASLAEARSAFPQHLDSIVHVPAPRWQDGDPRTYSLSQQATAWHNALDTTVLSAALTLQTIGDHLRAGGSVVNVVPESPRDGSAEAAVKAALSAWTADQAAVYGTRGITINVVAAGRGSQPGYDGLSSTAPSTAAEITRLALFLSTAGARHVTGQTLHVSTGALAHFG
ncbi:SDR family oxidoreductase [Mycolicibacterium tokaiense]|jgi:NAD(P)-dependent dehydrogenase (short-subunit alcohol dehydrogenase family)|uniref:Short chain dehydrogenase n=1 Tax=Mycolicibacterium tokaiense TaxID=39695 RepID=A0A378TP29_9MYCO|nr:SDR family oxidoreductase [Mycolicibacterium tokaiense]BBY89092.1 putative oxidoreductase [Mycolicibacterium tokaiense]STZ62521.1 short chain dehydrogenase [Mycolicibacterium tokaiense]